MNKRDVILLNDMLDGARKVQSFTVGKSRADLQRDDELLGYATVKALEVIGEAANHVSQEVRSSLLVIEWGDMIGMRNRLIHAYSAINYDIVWNAATASIPVLIIELEKLLASEVPEDPGSG